MITLERYQQETDETARTHTREAAAASILRQREHLARLYAAEAVMVLRRQFPQADRLTFTVDEDAVDSTKATVDVVAVFDEADAVLFPDPAAADTDDELNDASLICDMLAAAAEQGGADSFAAADTPSDLPPGLPTWGMSIFPSATHGLRIADLDGAYDEDRQAVMAALNLRTYAAEPQHGDRSAHVVLEVLGVTIGVRRRADETFVHLDTDELPEQFGPLVVEVDNGGENVYGA